MFRHPKHYKELRKLRNKSDQVISPRVATASARRAPDPGQKLQASEDSTANSTRGRVAEPQATSSKPGWAPPTCTHQATSCKQHADHKLQAASYKRSSHKQQAARPQATGSGGWVPPTSACTAVPS